MTTSTTLGYTPAQDAFIAWFLEAEYRPEGYRAQVMVGHPTIAALADAATAAVLNAGADPDRRVALIHPRPGETEMREVDVVEYFRKYGHEYCVALLSAAAPIDVLTVTTAAHAVGCAILWDMSAAPATTPAQLTSWKVDAAVSTTSEWDVFGSI